MLRYLKVSNFALIEQAEIEFVHGFNVLTGETGAGKSLLVDALNVVLGGRSSLEMIRSGSEQLRVEAIFEPRYLGQLCRFLEEQAIPLEEDGSLLICRTISRQGKNTSLVNGTHAPLSTLRLLGSLLLDMHGQHENQALLRQDSYLALLDGSQVAVRTVLTSYRQLFDQWRQTGDHIEKLEQDERQRAQRLDMLQWQIAEIEAAKLKDGEEEELDAKIRLLANAEKISGLIGAVWQSLAEGDEQQKSILDTLKSCRRQLEQAARFDTALRGHAEQLEQLIVQLDELTPELHDYLEGIEADPAALAYLQERMDLIYRLKQKYGNSVAEVKAYEQSARKELGELNQYDERLLELKQRMGKQEAELLAEAGKLHDLRTKAAKRLASQVESHLQDLGMPGARFLIRVEQQDRFSVTGTDQVRFEFTANPGEELRSLAKVASGGELSRVALAIKTVCAGNDEAQMMVFDEIDAGVGGQTARRVGEKIARVATDKQVLCITHLPQIAALADRHIHIEKQVAAQRSQTFVRVLSEEERLQELARMIGGEPVTVVGRKNAEEMVMAAADYKKGLNSDGGQCHEKKQ